MSQQPNEPNLTSPNSQLPKAPSFLSRLLGGTPKSSQSQPSSVLKEATGGSLPKKEEFGVPPQKPAKAQDWTPLDLSQGTIKKGIFGSRQSFKTHIRKDLKSGLGSLLNARQRGEISNELANLRQHGLGRGEVRKKLGEMVKKGTLSKFEAKKLRRELGATKSSFL